MENKKKSKGFVETPKVIVDLMHLWTKPKPTEILADFTAGRGQLFADHPKENCVGIELDDDNFAILHNKGFSKILHGDLYEKIQEMPMIDALVLNPPYHKKTNEMIALSLEKLKNGGRFAIISAKSTFSQFGKDFPRIAENLNISLAMDFDTNLFKPFAQVKTLLIFGEKSKKNQGEFCIQTFSNDQIIVNTRAKIIEPKITAPKREKNGTNGENFWEKLNEMEMFDTTPTMDDFKKTVIDYMAWETGFPAEFLWHPEKFWKGYCKLLEFGKKGK